MDVLLGIPVVPPATENEQADRTLVLFSNWCVEDRRPIELPVVPIRGVWLLDHGVDDDWALLIQRAS
jgi:hypothetical protein